LPIIIRFFLLLFILQVEAKTLEDAYRGEGVLEWDVLEQGVPAF
jgi:hypothetical protein